MIETKAMITALVEDLVAVRVSGIDEEGRRPFVDRIICLLYPKRNLVTNGKEPK